MVDSQHKSPLKKRRMHSSSDAIQQEVKLGQDIYSQCRLGVHLIDMLVLTILTQFMDLRTRYTALVTLITQYVKFASETLKRTEDEEVRDSYPNTFWLYTFKVATHNRLYLGMVFHQRIFLIKNSE